LPTQQQPRRKLIKYAVSRPAKLSAIVRQRNIELKETVADLSFRRIKEAVTALESRGMVIEVVDEGERLQTIAQDYAKNPSSTSLHQLTANALNSTRLFIVNYNATEP
jgi:hypothetical protein